MTGVPAHVARKQSAAVVPARPQPAVIEARPVTRRGTDWSVTGVFALLLAAFLLTGFLLSMLQQHA